MFALTARRTHAAKWRRPKAQVPTSLPEPNQAGRDDKDSWQRMLAQKDMAAEERQLSNKIGVSQDEKSQKWDQRLARLKRQNAQAEMQLHRSNSQLCGRKIQNEVPLVLPRMAQTSRHGRIPRPTAACKNAIRDTGPDGAALTRPVDLRGLSLQDLCQLSVPVNSEPELERTGEVSMVPWESSMHGTQSKPGNDTGHFEVRSRSTDSKRARTEHAQPMLPKTDEVMQSVLAASPEHWRASSQPFNRTFNGTVDPSFGRNLNPSPAFNRTSDRVGVPLRQAHRVGHTCHPFTRPRGLLEHLEKGQRAPLVPLPAVTTMLQDVENGTHSRKLCSSLWTPL